MEERDAASECPHHDDDQSVYRSDSPESHDAIFDFDAAVEEHDQTDKGDDGSTPKIGLQEHHHHCCRRYQERFLHRIVKNSIDAGLVFGNEPGQIKNQIQFHEFRRLEPDCPEVNPAARAFCCGTRP
ncbi:hypothetical protein SDC9_155801 [bioreactor metagenome]|uniref:Uncharacterized protein n=1 Tax=bioreactor metagenome TaxID=1076179 RepID=A0A645F515_9ZZZZ